MLEHRDLHDILVVDILALSGDSDVKSVYCDGQLTVLFLKDHDLRHQFGVSLLIIGVLGHKSFVILVDDLGLWDLVMSHLFFEVLEHCVFALQVAYLILK